MVAFFFLVRRSGHPGEAPWAGPVLGGCIGVLYLMYVGSLPRLRSEFKAREIAALERKLEAKEAQRGEALPVMRRFLDQAKKDTAKANTDPATRRGS